MKSPTLVFTFAFTVFMTGVLSPFSNVMSSEEVPLKVEDVCICKDVVNLSPIGIDSHFKASVGRLFCFSQIMGAQEPSRVTHVWYYGETKQAWVVLDVGSPKWRTYSSKAIQPHQVGRWRVEVLGPDVEVLETVEFDIVP